MPIRLDFVTLRNTLVVLLMTLLAACSQEQSAVQGFILPDGDVAAGETAFVELGCTICHVVAGSDMVYSGTEETPRIRLGGEVRRVKNYGELMNSIVNPNHDLAPEYIRSLPRDERGAANSPMPDFNEKLTVAQLIDIVAFLHGQYKETVPEYRGYQYVP